MRPRTLLKDEEVEMGNILIIFNYDLTFWKMFACPLHDECLLSLVEPILRELNSFPSKLMERPLRPLNGYY